MGLSSDITQELTWKVVALWVKLKTRAMSYISLSSCTAGAVKTAKHDAYLVQLMTAPIEEDRCDGVRVPQRGIQLLGRLSSRGQLVLDCARQTFST